MISLDLAMDVVVLLLDCLLCDRNDYILLRISRCHHASPANRNNVEQAVSSGEYLDVQCVVASVQWIVDV